LKIVAYILTLWVLFSDAAKPIKWELIRNENGIKVYTADVPEYPVKAIKTEVEFDAKLAHVVAVIMDVSNYTQWVYHCSESKLLQQTSPRKLIYRHVTSAPWPVQDRDQISAFTLTQKADGSLYVNSKTINNVLAEQPNYVRVTNSKAQWKLTALPNGKVGAEYQLFFNPAGSIPSWILNFFIANGPFETMLKVRERAKTSPYNKAELSDFF
jgi:hypothetical protein